MIKNFMEESLRKERYFKALLDVKNWFERHSDSVKYNKLYNQKGITLLLNGFLDNMDTFMRYGDFTEFILTEDRKKIILGKQEF